MEEKTPAPEAEIIEIDTPMAEAVATLTARLAEEEAARMRAEAQLLDAKKTIDILLNGRRELDDRKPDPAGFMKTLRI